MLISRIPRKYPFWYFVFDNPVYPAREIRGHPFLNCRSQILLNPYHNFSFPSLFFPRKNSPLPGLNCSAKASLNPALRHPNHLSQSPIWNHQQMPRINQSSQSHDLFWLGNGLFLTRDIPPRKSNGRRFEKETIRLIITERGTIRVKVCVTARKLEPDAGN